MTDAEKRELLFDRYAKNLTLYHPGCTDTFLCPLCLSTFGRDALDGPTPTLSLAHIIPDALGGTTCTLTCTECNNRFGSELEAHLIRYLNHHARLTGHGRVPQVRMKGTFGNVGVELELSRDAGARNSIFVVEKQSNKEDVARLKAFFETWSKSTDPTAFQDVQFNLSFQTRVKHKRTKIAFCHAAFLLMFHYFGYEYVLNPGVRAIRDQFFRPDERLFETQVMIPGNLSDTIFRHNPRMSVMFIDDVPAILAFLRVQAAVGPTQTVVVVMPGLETGPLRAIPEGTKFRGDVVAFMPDVALTEKWAAYKLWRMWRAHRDSQQQIGNKSPR